MPESVDSTPLRRVPPTRLTSARYSPDRAETRPHRFHGQIVDSTGKRPGKYRSPRPNHRVSSRSPRVTLPNDFRSCGKQCSDSHQPPTVRRSPPSGKHPGSAYRFRSAPYGVDRPPNPNRSKSRRETSRSQTHGKSHSHFSPSSQSPPAAPNFYRTVAPYRRNTERSPPVHSAKPPRLLAFSASRDGSRDPNRNAKFCRSPDHHDAPPACNSSAPR